MDKVELRACLQTGTFSAKVVLWQHYEKFPMIFGTTLRRSFRHAPRAIKAGVLRPMIVSSSTGCFTSCARARPGAKCRRNRARGKPSMTALPKGSGPRSVSKSGPSASIIMMTYTASHGSGKAVTAPMCARPWGEKEKGPNPTDRAKPGRHDHRLVDGRGVPLRVVVTAANVNDHLALPELLANHVLVRPQPSYAVPQHLCLDAGFDNEPTRQTVWRAYYLAHLTPKGGRPDEAAPHEGGQARGWVVERTHAWLDRFRRLVTNWEKTTASRSAFLCLACAFIAYRI